MCERSVPVLPRSWTLAMPLGSVFWKVRATFWCLSILTRGYLEETIWPQKRMDSEVRGGHELRFQREQDPMPNISSNQMGPAFASNCAMYLESAKSCGQFFYTSGPWSCLLLASTIDILMVISLLSQFKLVFFHGRVLFARQSLENFREIRARNGHNLHSLIALLNTRRSVGSLWSWILLPKESSLDSAWRLLLLGFTNFSTKEHAFAS